VLSSGASGNLAGRPNPDWQPGDSFLVDWEPSQKFFALLRGGQLGYRRIARFQTSTQWITPRITSLNPEITIFVPAQVSSSKTN
jgi:hypothetical protein